jgi:hypothetical protein
VLSSFATWDDVYPAPPSGTVVPTATGARLVRPPDEALGALVNGRWNVYVACCTFKARPARGRGTERDVLEVPGVWVDLDVKPTTENQFHTTAEADDFLTRMPPPTMLVDSGSGGRHAYWLLTERLDPIRGAALLAAWHDHVLDAARPVLPDNVFDITRVLRLPGTVRQPRGDDGIFTPKPVRLLHADGPRYDYEELDRLACPAHAAAEALRREYRRVAREGEEARRAEVQRRGLALTTYDDIRRVFEELADWDDLLPRAGWRLDEDLRDRDQGRRWTRPGKDAGTSATSDRGDSRDLWLFSDDPEVAYLLDEPTGHSRWVPRWRFALRALFEGDEDELLRAVVAGRGRLP